MLSLPSKCATCPSACTPASVRPAPRNSVGAPSMPESASSMAACTLGPFSWRCQPQKSVPSYSTVILKRIGRLELERDAGVQRQVGEVHLVVGAESGDVGVVQLAEEVGVVDAELGVDGLGCRGIDDVEEKGAARVEHEAPGAAVAGIGLLGDGIIVRGEREEAAAVFDPPHIVGKAGLDVGDEGDLPATGEGVEAVDGEQRYRDDVQGRGVSRLLAGVDGSAGDGRLVDRVLVGEGVRVAAVIADGVADAEAAPPLVQEL